MSAKPIQGLAAADSRPPFWQRALVSAWLSFWFVFVYNGCNYLTSLRHDVGTCAFPWELDLFPFIPALIIPYWSIDLFFVVAPLLIVRRHLLLAHLKRVSFGIAVAGIFFLLFPLKLAFVRPTVTGWLAPLFASLDNFNNFYNCAPSLHIVLRTNLWAIYVTPTRGVPRWILATWFGLIGASTLFCWQHHIIDVITGQLLGLVCLWLFPSIPFPRPYTSARERVNGCARLGWRYGLGSVALVVLAVLGWPGSVLVLWPAISLMMVAIAYAGGGPSLMRKRDGRQLPSTRWLIAPYRWLAGLTSHYFNAGRPAYFELRPGLYFGRRLKQAEAEALPVKAVLDLTAEYDEVHAFLRRQYRNIGILDLTLPSIDQLREAVEFLETHPSCYVHCSLGLGRTCLVAAAYLVKTENLTPEQATSEVQRCQPLVRLASGAAESLQAYARCLG